ncbi:MAG: trypsin-like peptidase domain-containing protein [Bosea sp. (in: a-proteobacteria)]
MVIRLPVSTKTRGALAIAAAGAVLSMPPAMPPAAHGQVPAASAPLARPEPLARSGALLPIAQSGSALAARAAPSVLRIVSFANEGGIAPAKVATSSLPPLQLNALQFPIPVELRAAFQGEACRLNGLEWCPVFKEETRGTAFAADRPGRFMTCRHIVQDWLHWARAYNPAAVEGRDMIPPFALADSQGKLAYVSTMRGGGGYRVSFQAESRRLDRPLKSLLRGDLFWDADFLQFDLASDLGARPLQRRESFDVGEQLLLLGYPDRVVGGEAAPLSASSGQATGHDRLTIVTNAPSAKGISGGPMLDSDGEVGGMACSIGRARGPRASRPALGLPVSPPELAARLRETHGVETIGSP